MKAKKEKMKVSYLAKVKRMIKIWTRLIGMMLKRSKMMAKKIKERKSKRRNKVQINKNRATSNKATTLISKNCNGTHKILNRSSNNNRNQTLNKKDPKINNPQKLNKSKNQNLKSQLKKNTNPPEGKSDNKSNSNLTVITNNLNNKTHTVSLILAVLLSINSLKLKSRLKEEEIPMQRKNSNISQRKKKEEKPTKKKLKLNPS